MTEGGMPQGHVLEEAQSHPHGHGAKVLELAPVLVARPGVSCAATVQQRRFAAEADWQMAPELVRQLEQRGAGQDQAAGALSARETKVQGQGPEHRTF